MGPPVHSQKPKQGEQLHRAEHRAQPLAIPPGGGGEELGHSDASFSTRSAVASRPHRLSGESSGTRTCMEEAPRASHRRSSASTVREPDSP